MSNQLSFKICRVCGINKLMEDYYVKPLSKDGHDSRCKLCIKLYYKNRHTAAKNKIGCVCCGSMSNLSNPDLNKLVYCQKCVAPNFYNIELYNQYLSRSILIQDYQAKIKMFQDQIASYEQQIAEEVKNNLVTSSIIRNYQASIFVDFELSYESKDERKA